LLRWAEENKQTTKLSHQTRKGGGMGAILSAGSVDNKFATCAAEASIPSMSSGASSERSATSNPANSEMAQE